MEKLRIIPKPKKIYAVIKFTIVSLSSNAQQNNATVARKFITIKGGDGASCLACAAGPEGAKLKIPNRIRSR